MNEKIDFVITWVDGNDEAWKKQKREYSDIKDEIDDSDVRYRDWNLLKYWFRGVEKYAPWVNRIHFVTWGHIPDWLNTSNEKINIVKHEDYIPKEYLPTFNSHTIELNLYRIKDLSEQFVYFNDDMFLLKRVKETDFFKNSKPCDSFAENILTTSIKNDIFPHILLNNMNVVNTNFNKRKFILKHFTKYFNIKYGSKNFRTLPLIMWNNFSMIYDYHIPLSLCKKTFEEVWDKENEILNETCKHRFRSDKDVSPYIFRYWQILNGKFYPRNSKFGKLYSVKDNLDKIVKNIKLPKRKVICINDSGEIEDFEQYKERLVNVFEEKLSEKSEFEI